MFLIRDVTKQFKNLSQKYLSKTLHKDYKNAQSKCEAQCTWCDSFLTTTTEGSKWWERFQGLACCSWACREAAHHGGSMVKPDLLTYGWDMKKKREEEEAGGPTICFKDMSPVTRWPPKSHTSQSSHYLQNVPSLEQVFNTGALGDIWLPHKRTWYTLTKRKFISYTVRPNVQFRDGWRSHFITMTDPLTRKARGLQTCT